MWQAGSFVKYGLHGRQAPASASAGPDPSNTAAPPPPGTSRSRPWAGDRPTGNAGGRLRQVRGREQGGQGQGAVRAGADGGRGARPVPVGLRARAWEARAARSGNPRHASYGSVAPDGTGCGQAGRSRAGAGAERRPWAGGSGRRGVSLWRPAGAGPSPRRAGSGPGRGGAGWRACWGLGESGVARWERVRVRRPGQHAWAPCQGRRAAEGGRGRTAGEGPRAAGGGRSAVGCRATRPRAAAGWPGQVEGMLRGWLPGPKAGRVRRGGRAGVVPLPVRPGGSSGRTGRESMAAAAMVVVVRVCGVCPGVTSRCVRLPPR